GLPAAQERGRASRGDGGAQGDGHARGAHRRLLRSRGADAPQEGPELEDRPLPDADGAPPPAGDAGSLPREAARAARALNQPRPGPSTSVTIFDTPRSTRAPSPR